MSENRWGPDAQIPPTRFEAFVLRYLYSDDNDLRTAGLWFLASALLAIPLLLGAGYVQVENYHLSTRGYVATARVTGTSYGAHRDSYSAVFVTGPVGRHVTIDRFGQKPAPGDVVHLRYDAKHPSDAMAAGMSPWRPADGTVLTLMALLFGAVMLAYGQRFVRRLRQARRARRAARG